MGPVAVIEIIKTVGAFAGVGAFVAVSLLAVLTISQARDVRRLREWAGRAPERAAAAEQVLVAYETGEQALEYDPEAGYDTAAVATPGGAGEAPLPAAPAGGPPPPPRPREQWQIEAEVAAAAELDARREERERSIYTSEPRSPLGEHSSLVMLGGALILVAALVFGALQLIGGGGGGGGAQPAGSTSVPKRTTGAPSPGPVRVAVLNGTAIPGLAAKVGQDVRSGGFKIGAVTNSQSSFDTTVVMFTRGHQPEAATLARQLGVQEVTLMTAEIQRVAKGAELAVIVGQDRAPTATPPPITPTTTPTPGIP